MEKRAIESCGYVEFIDGHKENIVLYDYRRNQSFPDIKVITEFGKEYFCSVEKVNREGIPVKIPVYRQLSSEADGYSETIQIKRIIVDDGIKPLA